MNWIKISRFGLCSLPLKPHILSCKVVWAENHHLFDWSCYFVSGATRKRHFSRASFVSRAVATTNSYTHLNSFLSRDSASLDKSAISCSLSFTHRRNLSNTSPESTDKQYHNTEAIRRANISLKDKEVDKVGKDLPKTESVAEEIGSTSEPVKKLTLYQRFKKTYKEHGKVLITVHLLTSAVWFGSFYTVARCGVDLVSLMENLNLSEKIISSFRSGSLGDVAVAYLMYKLATPARYTVTIGGTNLVIRYLRKEGRIPHVAHEDRIRSLYQESKEDIKRRSHIHLRRMRRKRNIKHRARMQKMSIDP